LSSSSTSTLSSSSSSSNDEAYRFLTLHVLPLLLLLEALLLGNHLFLDGMFVASRVRKVSGAKRKHEL
jgi:hypothetical protein